MATRIRLRREGRKGQSYFRIVVADSRAPRDGRFVALLGHYNPRTNPADIKVDAERARPRRGKGAPSTDTRRSLLNEGGALGQGPARSRCGEGRDGTWAGSGWSAPA